MIDLDWIIEQENKLTDRAKYDLGDNYFLSIDLLKLLQCIKSFSKGSEMPHVFVAQIMKGFHLTILNTIRRHSIEANLILRFTLESIVLFVYSMEHIKEIDYKIIRNGSQIIDYDENIKEKAIKHIEKRYPEFSNEIKTIKDFINSFYSHSNPLASQYNSDIMDGRLKAFVFDTYVDSSIREVLLFINYMMLTTLIIIKQLKKDYDNMFDFADDFENQFNELLNRQEKLMNDFEDGFESKEFWKDSKIMNKILKKVNKNGNDLLESNLKK